MHLEIRFTNRAEADLQQIFAYTLRIWGPVQAARTLSEMDDCCQWLAESPARGRASEGIRPGLRRADEGRYVIFFREIPGGIQISRILHHSMLLERRSTDAEDQRAQASLETAPVQR